MKMLMHLRCLIDCGSMDSVRLALAAPGERRRYDDPRCDQGARGYLLCGIGEMQAGFSQVDGSGVRSGLDTEFCTALAAAVFGSKDAVKFWPLSANDRFKALQAGDVDVLARGASWTLEPRHRARRPLCRRALLRRPRLPHAARQRGRERSGAVRRLDLRTARRDGRAGVAEFFGAQHMRYQIIAQGQLGRSRQSLRRRGAARC